MPLDPLAEAAALIREVGRSAQRARRYRNLATQVATPVFDRALAIGSDIRRTIRSSEPHPTAIAAAIAELRGLLAACENAIARVQVSALYREAVASFAAGATAQVAALAPTIFTDVTPHAPTGILYWAVPISGGRSGAHFLPPTEFAARVQQMATEGLLAAPSPPEFGGDDTIAPVLLSDKHDGSESPVALAFEPHTLSAPVCRLDGSNVVLFYAKRLSAAFTVTCSRSVDDEWWNVRPDAYQEYLAELREALIARALRVAIEP
jgi:hypothetical protein